MNNKNTIKQLVTMMEESGESPHYINGWMMSMIDNAARFPDHSIQFSIDSGIEFYRQKALLKDDLKNIQKVCNEARPEELYA